MKIFCAIFCWIFSAQFAAACALCALYTPTAHVKFTPTHMRWEFSPNFTQILLASYDANNDGKLADDELVSICEALKDYLAPRDYLLELSYFDLPFGHSERVQVRFGEPKISAAPDLVMDIDIDFHFTPQPERVLRLILRDDEGFFNFKILDEPLEFNGFSSRVNINLASAFYEFVPKNAARTPSALDAKNTPKSLESAASSDTPKSQAQSTPKSHDVAASSDTPKSHSNESFFAPILLFVDGLLQRLIALIKENSWALVPMAFAYGAAHALLPNHGKSLSAAHFASRKKGALAFALKVGFVHLASSYVAALVFGAFAAFRVGFASGYFVAALAVFLIICKLIRARNYQIKTAAKVEKLRKIQPAFTSSRLLNIARKKSWLDNANALLIGIIPCPGMVIVLGLIAPFGAAAVFAALAMALGISTSVYFCAYLSGRFNFGLKSQIFLLALVAIFAILLANSGV